MASPTIGDQFILPGAFDILEERWRIRIRSSEQRPDTLLPFPPMRADFVPQRPGTFRELSTCKSSPPETRAVRVTAFGLTVEHVRSGIPDTQVCVRSGCCPYAERYVAMVHQRPEAVQIGTVRQVKGKAVGTDRLSASVAVESEPTVAIIGNRPAPEPAIILPRPLTDLRPEALSIL